MNGTLLIGYDVERIPGRVPGEKWVGQPLPHNTAEMFLEAVVRIHREVGVPATLFVVGCTIERRRPQLEACLASGLFEIAQGWQVSSSFGYGAQYGFRARSQGAEALGGAKWFERRDKPRAFQGEITYLPRDEALARGFEQQRRHDLDLPFLWLPHPAEPLHWLRNAFLARNAELGLQGYAVFGRDRMPLSFEEVLG